MVIHFLRNLSAPSRELYSFQIIAKLKNLGQLTLHNFPTIQLSQPSLQIFRI